MSAMTISAGVFACAFGGALLGLLLQGALPRHHLSNESKDVVRLGMGLVVTLTAIVLGLLIASAKESFDAQGREMTELAANVILLDRLLAHDGSMTRPARDLLRRATTQILETTWSRDGAESGSSESPMSHHEALYDVLQKLAPKDDIQRVTQTQALSVLADIGRTRWLMYEQRTTTVSPLLLIVVLLWLTVILASFGLYAPANATVVVSLAVSALAVSGAIFLMLELYEPYSGVIQVSSAPLRAALAHLGQ